MIRTSSPLPLLLLFHWSCDRTPTSFGIQGRVLGVDGVPVGSALVVVGSATTRTRPDGTFFFMRLAPSENVLLHIHSPGYSTWQDHIAVEEGAWSYVEATLALVERVYLPDATQGGEVETSTGLRLRFPAGAVVDNAGAPVSGPVTVSVAHVNEANEVLAAPGGLELGERGGRKRRERSWGLAELELSQDDEALQLRQAVTLSMPLAEDWEGEDLRLTWFNPSTDLWEVESDVRIQGGRALAKLEHFSWYGVGRPVAETACVSLPLKVQSGGRSTNLPPGTEVLVVGTDALSYGWFEVEKNGLVHITGELDQVVNLRLHYGIYEWVLDGVIFDQPMTDYPDDCGVYEGGTTAGRQLDQDGDGFPAGPDCQDDPELDGAEIHPAAEEVWYDDVDQDCDEWSDYDQDHDGDDCAPSWLTACSGADCDDEDPTQSGTHQEVCDRVDNDCDVYIDEDALDALVWYVDADGDGYGTDLSGVSQCTQPSGYSDQAGDCDDANPCAYPSLLSAREADGNDPCIDAEQDVCGRGADLEDLDCNGFTGTGDTDKDGDGFGACDDCDESDVQIYPGQTEDCNGLDDDCDGLVDEGLSITWYRDADGDGFGDPGTERLECDATRMSGWVMDGSDCDDLNSLHNPDGVETCDGLDSDCDEAVDEDAADATVWYTDADGDGYGGTEWVAACERSEGTVDLGEDCYDADDDSIAASVYPGAEEICNDGMVQDCGVNEAEARTICNQGVRSLTQADLEIVGEEAGDAAGSAVASAGDVDGDGLSDLLVGATFQEDGGGSPGATYLLLSGGALAGAGATLDLAGADLKMVGEGDNDLAGSSVAGAGDVDGDGRSDLILGAPQRDDESETGWGASYLVLSNGTLGSGGPTLGLSGADFTFMGEYSGCEAGTSVSSAGDVDGDGRADLLVGGPCSSGVSPSPGEAYLLLAGGALSRLGPGAYLAEADVRLYGETDGDVAGRALASAGDVDGDGLSDLLVGADGQDDGGEDAGAAYLLLAGGALLGAGSSMVLGDADLKMIGETSGDAAGAAVSGAGDVDGDGLTDLLVGAPQRDGGGGASYLLLTSGALAGTGPTLTLGGADCTLTGEQTGDYAGRAVAGAGDVEGDGLADILIGAPFHLVEGMGSGASYLLLSSGSLSGAGPTLGLADADLKLIGEDSADYAGIALASAGDVNGDGLADLLVGAPLNNSGGHDSGAAYLILGRSF